MNVMCLGSRVVGAALARTLVEAFLKASFSADERHLRRLARLTPSSRVLCANELLLPKLIAAIGFLVALLLFGREAAVRLPTFAAWVQSLGVWGPLAFILGYGLAAILLVPAFLLTLSAGALWGFRLGMLYVSLGASLGAALAFLAARYVVRRFVEAYVDRHPRLAAIDRAVEAEGARLVLLLRLSPLVPYVLLNYILGISRVRFRDYMLGLAGMLPIVAVYVYAGKVAGDLATLAAGASAPRGATYIGCSRGARVDCAGDRSRHARRCTSGGKSRVGQRCEGFLADGRTRKH